MLTYQVVMQEVLRSLPGPVSSSQFLAQTHNALTIRFPQNSHAAREVRMIILAMIREQLPQSSSLTLADIDNAIHAVEKYAGWYALKKVVWAFRHIGPEHSIIFYPKLGEAIMELRMPLRFALWLVGGAWGKTDSTYAAFLGRVAHITWHHEVPNDFCERMYGILTVS